MIREPMLGPKEVILDPGGYPGAFTFWNDPLNDRLWIAGFHFEVDGIWVECK